MVSQINVGLQLGKLKNLLTAKFAACPSEDFLQTKAKSVLQLQQLLLQQLCSTWVD